VAEGLDHEYADVLEDPWVFQHVGFFLVQRSTETKNNKTVAVKNDARSKMAKSTIAELPRPLRGDLDSSWIDKL
jgi:hypothetical protein